MNNLDEIAETIIKNRMNQMACQYIDSMNRSLYGDRISFRERSKLDRLKIKFRIYRSRISDAWSVLIGKAEIGGDY